MTDLDHAYVINGSDLRWELGGRGAGEPLVPDPQHLAEYLVGAIGRPYEPVTIPRHTGRWPMTREELITRLSLALKETPRHANPAVHAGRLTDHIDRQGHGTGAGPDDGEPLSYDAEITAMAAILAELDAIGGESGAGYEAEDRVVRWLADRYGYTVRRGGEHPF